MLYSIYFVAVTLLFQLLAMFSCFTMYAICQPALDTRKQFVIESFHHVIKITNPPSCGTIDNNVTICIRVNRRIII